MKHYVLASHGGFSKGIYESIQIIIGEQPRYTYRHSRSWKAKTISTALVSGDLWQRFRLRMKSSYAADVVWRQRQHTSL